MRRFRITATAATLAVALLFTVEVVPACQIQGTRIDRRFASPCCVTVLQPTDACCVSPCCVSPRCITAHQPAAAVSMGFTEWTTPPTRVVAQPAPMQPLNPEDAVSQPADAMSNGFTKWMTQEELKRHLETHPYRGTGLWITAVEGRWHNGIPQYQLREGPLPKGRAHVWFWWHGEDEESFSRKLDEYAKKGFRLVHHQSYTRPGGSVRHQGVWQKLGKPTAKAVQSTERAPLSAEQKTAKIQVSGKPVNLGPTVNSGFNDVRPALTPDGLTIFFHSNRPGGLGGDDLWMCMRAALSESFGKPINLGPAINSNFNDAGPTLSPDGLTLLFHSNRPKGLGKHDLWMCSRASLKERFGEPINMGPNVNSRFEEFSPALSGDGRSLLFWTFDTRPGGQGGPDLWMCSRPTRSEPFGTPVNLGPPVNSSFGEYTPALSADGLTLLFASNRPGGLGERDLWLCVRKSVSDPFGEPLNLGPSVNSEFGEHGPFFSADGLTPLFNSDRPGGQGNGDLWILAK